MSDGTKVRWWSGEGVEWRGGGVLRWWSGVVVRWWSGVFGWSQASVEGEMFIGLLSFLLLQLPKHA